MGHFIFQRQPSLYSTKAVKELQEKDSCTCLIAAQLHTEQIAIQSNLPTNKSFRPLQTTTRPTSPLHALQNHRPLGRTMTLGRQDCP
jgi:hypothetical protein